MLSTSQQIDQQELLQNVDSMHHQLEDYKASHKNRLKETRKSSRTANNGPTRSWVKNNDSDSIEKSNGDRRIVGFRDGHVASLNGDRYSDNRSNLGGEETADDVRRKDIVNKWKRLAKAVLPAVLGLVNNRNGSTWQQLTAVAVPLVGQLLNRDTATGRPNNAAPGRPINAAPGRPNNLQVATRRPTTDADNTNDETPGLV